MRQKPAVGQATCLHRFHRHAVRPHGAPAPHLGHGIHEAAQDVQRHACLNVTVGVAAVLAQVAAGLALVVVSLTMSMWPPNSERHTCCQARASLASSDRMLPATSRITSGSD